MLITIVGSNTVGLASVTSFVPFAGLGHAHNHRWVQHCWTLPWIPRSEPTVLDEPPRAAPVSLIELVFHGGKEAFAIADADGDILVAYLDLAFADMLDLADGDDIGAVGPYELPGGKL